MRRPDHALPLGARLALTLGALLVLASPAPAAEVEIQVSSQRVDVGIPFQLTIEISDAQSYETPALPEMEGLRVLAGPATGKRSLTTVVGGRTTQHSSVALTWSLVALTPGSLTIPPIEVVADGLRLVSSAIPITARKPETGDLMFVEIASDRAAVYLGEAVPLTLRVWIKPYDSERLPRPLSRDVMFRFVVVNRSTWGDFETRIADEADPFSRRVRPSGRSVRRRDGAGEEATYYLYEFETEIWPQQAGPLEVRPVAVMMEYPTRLERSRRLLSRGELRLAENRRIVAIADAPTVEVRLPPEAGRPDTFAGAVGRFEIDATAKPSDVAVGDPITVAIRITDRSSHPAPLKLLAPPPLARVSAVTEHFKVPSDALAGVVDGRVKTFTETFRARDAEVAAIPPIPFTFFDPEAERYVTVATDAIPLQVRPASTLSMSDVVGGAPVTNGATELTETAGGILANVSGADVLLANQRQTLGWPQFAVLFTPPLLVAFLAIGQRRLRRLRDDTGYARRRTARRTALGRLHDARRGGDDHQAERVAAAVSHYVADRVNAPPGALTRAEVVAHLRRSNVTPELTEEIETLLEQCEQSRFAGGSPPDPSGRREGDPGGSTAAREDILAHRATQCVNRLERERIR